MGNNVWILNHYAGTSYINEGGRHYWIAENLIKKGHPTTIFCSNIIHNSENYIDTNKHIFERKEINNIPYVFVKTVHYKNSKIKRIMNMVSFYLNIQKVFREYLKFNEKPDVIYASSVHPLTLIAGIKLAKSLNIPCITEIRDLWPESLVAYGIIKQNSIIAKILYSFEKRIYIKSDEIVMTWEGGKDYIKDKNWDKAINLEKVHHISNGVSLKQFDYNVNLYENSGKVETYNFVYTGSIRKVNNVNLLVDAAKVIQDRGIKNIKILIYGDGNEKDNLINKCKMENIENILFKGKVEKKKIPSILCNSYVNLLHNTSTSLNKYGQSQNKLFEYLAAERPIIQTYFTDYNIIDKYNCGVVLRNQNKYEIADCIIKTCEHPEEMQEKGKNARYAAYHHDFEVLTEKILGIIKKSKKKGKK
ncbi:glycosyltransferase family 4 protein [Staphylococcus saprophyticus]|uniref:glycosyltransferase family 4 protein n=1 Tax=Staphylococcus saprophyticus TaxID=29385 RepID=UPI00119D8698|nr:glycosyltransferase family 4 protein [Staphylococcus saprophyticus]MDW3990622.1 glycosyltransferase family 4 protein [Staphylococcus saprophyticus]